MIKTFHVFLNHKQDTHTHKKKREKGLVSDSAGVMAPLSLLTHQTCFLLFATYTPFFLCVCVCFYFSRVNILFIFCSCRLWSFSRPDAVGKGIVPLVVQSWLTIAKEMV